MSSAQHDSPEASPRLTVHEGERPMDPTLRTPLHHLKRAVRTLRYSAYRVRRELATGFGRAGGEVKNAAKSAYLGLRKR